MKAATSEAAGYLAMLAFLAAYLLNVAGLSQSIQFVLNLSGAAIGAGYLSTKGAVPSVISNVAWGAITVIGFIAR